MGWEGGPEASPMTPDHCRRWGRNPAPRYFEFGPGAEQVRAPSSVLVSAVGALKQRQGRARETFWNVGERVIGNRVEEDVRPIAPDRGSEIQEGRTEFFPCWPAGGGGGARIPKVDTAEGLRPCPNTPRGAGGWRLTGAPPCFVAAAHVPCRWRETRCKAGSEHPRGAFEAGLK